MANNLVYFPSGDGHLYAIRHGCRETPGQFPFKWIWAQFWLWHLPVPRPPPQAGSVWRISPDRREKGFAASPAVTPEALYIGDQQGWFYGFDAAKGTKLWKFKAGGCVSASPLVLGDRVYFGSEDGYLYVLNRRTGQLIWKTFLNAPAITSPAYASGLIFLRTGDGKLHAIE